MDKPTLKLRVKVPLDTFNLGISCEFKEHVIGIYGPSGSGKTTLLESIAGLRQQAKGFIACEDEVWLNSKKSLFKACEQRDIGYVPQDHLLFPHFKVRKNLEFGARRAKNKDPNFEQTFEEVVEVLKLGNLLESKVSQLSGGEKQRVSLGRALCSGPRLLMLDEPTASLDIQLRQKILPFLLKVKNHFKIPIIIVSHNPFELQALCDEIIALKEGRIIAQGSPTEIFTRSNIYSANSAEGFQNIIPGKIHSHSEHTSQISIGSVGKETRVSMLRSKHEIGENVLIGFPANDILLSTKRIEGISARNQLAATIQEIQSVDSKQVIIARLDQEENSKIVIELSMDAVHELELKKSSAVYLIIKSSSITVYG